MDLNGDGEYLNLELRIRGNHPTMGLEIYKNGTGQIVLDKCAPSTPAARLPKWRSQLKLARIKKVHDTPIKHSIDIINAIAQAKTEGLKYINISFALEKRVDMHPQLGIPQLHYDQLCVINMHHHVAITGETILQDITEGIPDHNTTNQVDVKTRLTRKKLLIQEDWPDWETSEFLQLDQYALQGMFGKPTALPTNNQDFNILPMIWNYLLKNDGRKKAHCVADGSGKQQGSITLDHIYAACLRQPGARMFWGAVALKNLVAYGAH